MNHSARQPLYREIERERDSRVLALVNGERLGLQTQIAMDAVSPFVSLLDAIRPTKKLSLILDTNGGQTSAAWRLLNLIRSFCDELEVIVPSKAMSAGTLMALGADKIVMTKQGALGPIDPSLDNHPLGPSIAGPTGHALNVPVSTEAIRGYITEVRKDVTDPTAMASVWNHLADKVHPLVLGDIFRNLSQIRMLASDLMVHQVKDEEKRSEIIELLCSESGSHDYTINRRQADKIGLNIEKPSSELYEILARVGMSYSAELQTLVPFSAPALLAGQASARYSLIRGLIESSETCYGFMTEGFLTAPKGGQMMQEQKTFEGWRELP